MIGLLLFACQGSPQPGSNRLPDEHDTADADNDGYDTPSDCNDTDPAIHPGAAETCGNGIDDNCNSTSDGCDWSGDSILQGTEIAGSDHWSSLGRAFAICDANGDGQLDIVAGAYLANDFSGAVYVFYGPIESDRDAKGADYVLTGTTPIGLAGYALDCGGDRNGDGMDDLVVSEPGVGKTGHTTGTVYVVPGGGVGTAGIGDVATSTIVGTSDQAQLGYGTALLDADGDEIQDVATWSWGEPKHTVDYGHAYVFADPAPGTMEDVDATAHVDGTENDLIWGAANVGDLDGDGLDELAVAGPASATTDGAFVFRAPLVGALSKADADVRIVDDQPGFGSALGHVDVDDDGTDDLVAANIVRDDRAGAAYVFYGRVSEDTSTADADVRLLGSLPNYSVGCAIASAGDVDGDGKRELLIGAYEASTVYLHYGGDPGVYDVAKDAQASFRREEKGAGAGSALAAGDVTGDGFPDFAISVPGLGDHGEGAIFVMPNFDR